MSNDYKISDLMKQFNLEDESNEQSSSLKESQIERHKTSSSLVDKIDMKIEKKLTDITNNNQRISKKKPTRDKFGYFFNYKVLIFYDFCLFHFFCHFFLTLIHIDKFS